MQGYANLTEGALDAQGSQRPESVLIELPTIHPASAPALSSAPDLPSAPLLEQFRAATTRQGRIDRTDLGLGIAVISVFSGAAASVAGFIWLGVQLLHAAHQEAGPAVPGNFTGSANITDATTPLYSLASTVATVGLRGAAQALGL